MHAVQVSFYLDPQHREPSQLLEDWPSLPDVAEAVASAGAHVSVVQACHRSASLARRGVDYHFVAAGRGATALSTSREFAHLIDRLKPDVLHVHGFGFPRDVQALARLAHGVPILLQDHANGVPRIWRRASWRRGFAAASGLSITGTAKLQQFKSAGLLHAGLVPFDIPESSSRFEPGDRLDARTMTGLDGDPCALWVGHLNPNKDPLTVLAGVSHAARLLPGLKLWCCFGSAPLLNAVRRCIAGDPALSGRVQLLGPVPHARVELLMRAADVLVLGSHVEGSGYSVLEALACGLPACVTDIPAFRSVLGGDGIAGRLWTCGQSQTLSEALINLHSQPPTRSAVRAHFDRELSFAAVGRKLNAAYQHLLERRDAADVVSGAATSNAPGSGHR